MLKKLRKITAICLLSILSLASCKKESSDLGIIEIDKAIELIHNNNSIKDTLHKFRKDYGVDLIVCYTITTDNHRKLAMQVMQSANQQGPPIKINRPFKIETVQGIDIFFVSNKSKLTDKYNLKIDDMIKKLVNKGYLTINGREQLYCTTSIDFIFCIDNDATFSILSPEFKWKQEANMRNIGMIYDERKFYPKCDN